MSQTQAALVASAFLETRLKVMKLCSEAAGLPGLSDVERAHMRMLAGLAGLQFPRLSAEASPAELRGVASDLEALWRHVDPFIAVIGRDAAGSANGIDMTCFRDQLRGALEGNATFNLFDIAAGIEESDRAEDGADMWRDFQPAAE